MTWATVSNFELCGATSGLLENHPKTNLTCSTGEQNTPWPEPTRIQSLSENDHGTYITEKYWGDWDSPSSFSDSMTGCLGWMNTVLDSRWWLQVVFWNFSPTTAKKIQSDELFFRWVGNTSYCWRWMSILSRGFNWFWPFIDWFVRPYSDTGWYWMPTWRIIPLSV